MAITEQSPTTQRNQATQQHSQRFPKQSLCLTLDEQGQVTFDNPQAVQQNPVIYQGMLQSALSQVKQLDRHNYSQKWNDQSKQSGGAASELTADEAGSMRIKRDS